MNKLTLYLEKNIILILLNQVNKFNRTIPNYSESSESKLQKNQEIVELVKSLSLVNWFWFNSVSSLLDSIVNFNHSPIDSVPSSNINSFKLILNKDTTSTLSTSSKLNKFKLIKNDNIKYLRIELGDFKLQDKSDEEKDQLLRVINNNISNSYCNLKKLIISNSEDLDEIYFINCIKFNNIKISFLYLNQQSQDGGDTPLLSSNIKQVLDIEGEDIPIERAVSILKPLRKVKSLILAQFGVSKFKQLYIQLYLNGDESKLMDSGSGSCCLSYAENLTIDDFQVQTIESLYYALKLVPRVKTLSFQICFDNLIKQIDNSGDHKGCICSKQDECNKQFNYYWDGINQIIQQHKHLSVLSIGQHCFYPIAYSKPFQLPDEFVSKFGTMLGNNKSIKYLKTSKLPSNIINLIEFISTINQNICYHKHFFFNMSGPLPNEYVLEYNSLLEKYKHIKMFLIDDALTNSEVLTYSNK